MCCRCIFDRRSRQGAIRQAHLLRTRNSARSQQRSASADCRFNGISTLKEDNMKRYLSALIAIAALCMGSAAGAATTEENPADLMALHNVEIVFHQAASTKNLDLMMSLFADGATLTDGGKTYTGKDQVRSYFASVAGSFQPQNKWVAYTPAQRIRIDINGNQAHLYFE